MQTQINYTSKTITVACNADAMVALDYGNANSDQILEYHIPENEFNFLIKSEIIESINKICDCMIDEYEDEMIDDIPKLEKTLYFLNKIDKNIDNDNIVNGLIEMFSKAIELKTAIYFYF